jgi:hypothetical protein
MAFKETIKQKIREAALTQFGDDVIKYLIYVKNNLCLITSSMQAANTHGDLLTYLFQQLKLTSIKWFQDAIDKWHIKFLEAKLRNLAPESFLKLFDDKMQILKHAGQWQVSDHPEIMALKMELARQKADSEQMLKHVVAHVGKLSNFQCYTSRSNESTAGGKQKQQPSNNTPPRNYPPWMTIPPSTAGETKLVERRLHTWCTKCCQGQGLWVCHHNTATHIDGYSSSRNQR